MASKKKPKPKGSVAKGANKFSNRSSNASVRLSNPKVKGIGRSAGSTGV